MESMNFAKYFNKATNETYRLGGVDNLEKAWDLAEFVCQRNNWNFKMFSYDVLVKIVKR